MVVRRKKQLRRRKVAKVRIYRDKRGRYVMINGRKYRIGKQVSSKKFRGFINSKISNIINIAHGEPSESRTTSLGPEPFLNDDYFELGQKSSASLRDTIAQLKRDKERLARAETAKIRNDAARQSRTLERSNEKAAERLEKEIERQDKEKRRQDKEKKLDMEKAAEKLEKEIRRQAEEKKYMDKQLEKLSREEKNKI
jgi:hypothetical protein